MRGWLHKRYNHTMGKSVNIFLFIFCCSIAVANERNVIRMTEIVKAGHVVVKPKAEYNIDLAGYEKPDDAKLLIFHVLDSPRSHYYYQELKAGKSLYRMSETTLQATKDSPPFRGLKTDDSAFLIIGSEVQPGSIEMGVLYSNESISVIVRD